MKTKVSLVIITAILAVTLACSSKIETYVDLAVDSTVNGLTLANSFGAQIPASTLAEAKSDGDLLKKAVADWIAATPDGKTTAWAEVQKDLTIFQTNLPAFLKAAHVDNPAYANIANLAIAAVEAAVNFIESQNTVAGVKRAPAPFDVKGWKNNYNGQMRDANHPELQLK